MTDIRPRPVQIVAASEDEDDTNYDEFTLKKDALAGILSKVPEGMLVSVVSVVGAFRTGKSFLLTLFLRYLRQRAAGMSYKDMIKGDRWLYADGEVIVEGNRNKCGSMKETDKDTEENDKNGGRGEDEGFAWRGGQDRMTTGIWMWSEPFLHYSEEAGQEVAVLLMDTQGMFDNETTMNLTAQIFSISTLVSSFQIYNVQNSIGEDKMMHLALFSEYGRIALQPPGSSTGGDSSPKKGEDGGDSGSGEDEEDLREIWKDRSGSGSDVEHEEEGGREGEPFNFKAEVKAGKLKPFQDLLFLVRDWPNFDEILESSLNTGGDEASADGVEAAFIAEMRDYFKSVIGVRGQTDLQSTRDQISRCFEGVSAFLLPHPGTAVTKKNFNGSLSSLEPVFRRLVGLLARMVFDDMLEPKRVHMRRITASELMAYFEAYTALFKDGNKNFPPALTMLDATAQANNRNAYDLAFAKYRECMDSVLGENSSVGYFRPSDLRAFHDNAVQKSWKIFKGVANMGSPKAIEELGLKLNDDITREYKHAVRENDLRNPFRDFELYFVPIMVAVLSWLASWILHLTCSHAHCAAAQSVFNNIYGYLLVIGLVLFWQHIRRGVQYAKLVLGGGVSAAMEKGEERMLEKLSGKRVAHKRKQE